MELECFYWTKEDLRTYYRVDLKCSGDKDIVSGYYEDGIEAGDRK